MLSSADLPDQPESFSGPCEEMCLTVLSADLCLGIYN